ncbi:MAG: hypothetical protein AMS18_09860 [Gemmatimonas sp. SG8_17]|nr:MAG: hypothetical protein AMS18_09860 [Gemmatimonas sp. SG8_17]
MIVRGTVVVLATALSLVSSAVSVDFGRQIAPTIRTVVDTSRVTVGDRISVMVTVEHGADQQVRWPDSIDFGSFELLDATQLDPVFQDGRVRSGLRIILAAFELGELEIPSFDVTVADMVGPVAALSTDPWDVTVVSVGQDDSGDIRNIKEPLAIARNWLLLLPWIVVVVTVAVFAFWLYRRYADRRDRQDGVALAEPALAPHETAYERLDRLAGSGMLERGEVKPYYIAVSEIVRAYLEARFQIAAMEMATYEVMEGLERIAVDLETRIGIERFLSDCDLVKFAKWRPGLADCRDMIPRARKLVDETRERSAITKGVGEGADAVVTGVAVTSQPDDEGGTA